MRWLWYATIITDSAQKAEGHTYAYRLCDGVTDNDVRAAVRALDFDYSDVQDKYFRKMISEITDKRDDLQSGVNELDDGAKALRDTLEQLLENGGALAEFAPERDKTAAACIAPLYGRCKPPALPVILTFDCTLPCLIFFY